MKPFKMKNYRCRSRSVEIDVFFERAHSSVFSLMNFIRSVRADNADKSP